MLKANVKSNNICVLVSICSSICSSCCVCVFVSWFVTYASFHFFSLVFSCFLLHLWWFVLFFLYRHLSYDDVIMHVCGSYVFALPHSSTLLFCLSLILAVFSLALFLFWYICIYMYVLPFFASELYTSYHICFHH